MAEDDYAIVVGVSRYPNMQGNDLLGPDHDATDFADWLVNGGQVPKDHLHLKLYHSSGYDAKATPPEPTQFQVASDAFETLGVLAESTSRIGRRLYIYLAGHGIGFINPKGEVGLLMANAALRRPGYHIPGHAYADWFVTAGCFDEVVLLMDCCRTSLNMSPPAAFPCVPKLKSRPGLVKWFYGHATLPAATAREKPVGPGGEMRGLFTMALLTGLRGGITDRPITGFRLKNWVEGYLDEHDTSEDRQKPEILDPHDFVFL